MKKGIHPEYMEAKVICSCGNVIQTRSTKPELHIEICSSCHPFFTGKQKFVDTAGRVERFQKRYEKYQQKSKSVQKKEKPVPAIVQVSQDKPKVKIEKKKKPVTATAQAEPQVSQAEPKGKV